MIVAKEILEINSFSIVCRFNNGEVRKLDVDKILSNRKGDIYADKILIQSIFNSVKIGELGQLYWENVAQMTDDDGKLVPCEYDMSPEFVYHNSKHI